MELITSNHLHTNTSQHPSLPSFAHTTTPKFPLEYCYYTDGSFIPSKQINEITWLAKRAAYGIYNEYKQLEISKRLHGLQNILHAELIALYDTIKMSLDLYQDKPIHIFTDSLNSLYLLNIQIRHPSLHTNHPNKTILSDMVQMLQERTNILTVYKVIAHSNITGNNKADELAKAGYEYEH